MLATHQTSRIAIIGAGDVGAAIAFALILNPIAAELVLVDVDEVKRDGQVQDLSDATYGAHSSCRIKAGTAQEAGQCDVIVITAGAKQKKGTFIQLIMERSSTHPLTPTAVPGESRIGLIDRNLKILRSVITSLEPINPHGVLLLVSNPVDILVHFAQRFSSLPTAQVLGTGTFLDSLRLRGLLAEKAPVAASSVDSYVLGEHGDSQFVAWSAVTIGGVPLKQALPESSIDRKSISEATKRKAHVIIEAKGATMYGIGSVVRSICGSVLFDKHNVKPVSCFVEEMGCCLSMPVVLGRKGVVRRIHMPLNEEETEALEASARELRKVIENAEKEAIKGSSEI